MRQRIKFNEDGSITHTWDSYDFTQELKAVFPHCQYCDTNGSYTSRVETANSMINTIIDLAIAREKKRLPRDNGND